MPAYNSKCPKMLKNFYAMPKWESIVAQKDRICRVQWLALRSWCLQFICLERVYYGPDIVWFRGTLPTSKLSAGTMILGCIFWQSRDDQEFHDKTRPRPELELSCSSTLEVSITPWVHEHFTSHLPKFLRPGDPLFRLSLADISQVIQGKPQVPLGNRGRCWLSLKASQTLSDTTQKYERTYRP